MYETVVIGSGPAGLSAALYLKRAGKDVIVIEKEYEGAGQITRSIRVENYLGIQALSGEELGDKFRQHVISENISILEDEVTEIIKKEILAGLFIIRKKAGDRNFNLCGRDGSGRTGNTWGKNIREKEFPTVHTVMAPCIKKKIQQ